MSEDPHQPPVTSHHEDGSTMAMGRTGKRGEPLGGGLTRFCCLDGGVDETFSPTHGVEEELGGGEPGQVGVLHEPPTFGAVIVFDEVGQRTVLETKGDPLPFHVLLPHNRDDLPQRLENTTVLGKTSEGSINTS